jgi:hypothetical protein
MRAFAHPTGLFDIVKKDCGHALASAGTIWRVYTGEGAMGAARSIWRRGHFDGTAERSQRAKTQQ